MKQTLELRALAVAASLVMLSACSFGDSESKQIAAGKAKLAEKDVRAAIIHFKSALSKNEGSGEARLLLGKALLQTGDAPAAIIELQRALELMGPEQVSPELARAMLAAGQAQKLIAQFSAETLRNPAAQADLKSSLAGAHAETGNLASAREAAGLALQIQPGFATAEVILARLDRADGRDADALKRLDAVLAADPANEAAGMLKHEMQLAAGNGDGAMKTARGVLAANPKSARAQGAVVDLLLGQGKREEARAEFAKLKQMGPALAETLTMQAVLAFEDKDYKGALESTDRLLAAQPNNLRALLVASAANFRLQRLVLAQGHLGSILKLQPGHVGARQLLARTYILTARPEKAIEVLKPLLDAPSTDIGTLSLAGEAYLQAGDVKRSDAALQRAQKAQPNDPRLRATLAAAKLATGDATGALQQLESIARADPGAQADIALASAQIGRRNFKGAMAALDSLEKKLPDQAFPVATRGLVHYLQGDKAGAATALERALKLQPGYFPAVARLAGLDLEAGQPDKARQRFQDLVKADPKNIRARLAVVDIDARSGAPQAQVLAQLREAIKASPAEPVAHLALIDRLLASGDTADALAAAQEAHAALPDDQDIFQALGRVQIAAGETRGAVGTFKRLTGLQPNNPSYLVMLGEAATVDKDRTQAAQAFRKALELQPGHVQATRGQALLAVEEQRFADAVAMARGLQQRNPKDAAGFALEGEIEAQRKNWGAASTAFKAALAREKNPGVAILLHRTLSEAQQQAEASRFADEWRRDQPADAGFVAYLAEREVGDKDWAGAEALYRSLLKAQPRNAVVMNNVAWLMAQQRKPGAVAMAEAALGLAPERATFLNTLALALDTEGQSAKALETQKKAVALSPKEPSLRLQLARFLLKDGRKSDARAELELITRLGVPFAGLDEAHALLKTL
jgi:cellulose synthase operon protein C